MDTWRHTYYYLHIVFVNYSNTGYSSSAEVLWALVKLVTQLSPRLSSLIFSLPESEQKCWRCFISPFQLAGQNYNSCYEGAERYFPEPWLVNICLCEMLDFGAVKCDLFCTH